ncbi:MAG: sugar transferase [Albidovulum sp.]
MRLNDLSDHIVKACAPVGLVTVPRRRGIYRNGLKRCFDLFAVAVASVIVIPLIVIMAIIVGLEGKNPFYTSDRVGRGGKTFRMLKLRTMVENADKQLADYLEQNPEARIEWDTTQKLKFDPRTTATGRFLRKTSLDELPQLWNVIVGDMSLVGPRPMMPSQRAIYEGLAYYGLRPGLTGLWQISDRNESGFYKRAEYDTLYDEKLSFLTDMTTLIKTVGTVMRGTGY